MADNRWKSSGDYVYNQVITKVGVKKHSYSEAALWAYADSLLNMQPMRAEGRTIDGMTPMFSVGKLTFDVNAFITYGRTFRFRQDGSGAKPHNEVRDDWEKYVMLNYYRDNLEDFNEEFRNQMTEFRDGNLFFEIMQQEVWNKAQSDSTALLDLYNKNKQNYVWKQSADVVIYFCTDQASANMAYEAAKKKPADWRNIIGMYSEKVMGDSSRYEWSQIPNLNKMIPKAGMLTTPVINTTDNTVSFAYIIKSYPQSTQRSFNEARGLVTNDYQEILEKKWDEELKKKYPVVVDEKVLQSISK